MVIADDVRIVLVRHGETEWSRSGRHTSFTDVALTAQGARRRARWRRASPESSSRSYSPARAHVRATRAALAGLGGRAEVTDDLAEWDYGRYEGSTTAEIRRDVPNWTIFSHGAPDGETTATVAARADRVIERACEAGGVVALFSHGHFLRVLGARWVGLPPSAGALLALDTATLSFLGHEREQRVLRVWNS